MPRKKTEGTPSTRKNAPPFAARYIRVCTAAMYESIVHGDEAEASRIQSEVREYIDLTFRDPARTAFLALVDWIWETAQSFARQRVEAEVRLIDAAYDAADAAAAKGGVIDHE